MREPKYHLYLSHEEVRLIIQVLIDKRNKLIQMGKYTDAVDDLIIMEDLFKMYRRGLVSWEDAYVKANNRMVEASEEKSSEVVDYWASQVQTLWY